MSIGYINNTNSRMAFAYAVANDRNGVVSEADARRIVNSGLAEISSSDHPQAAYETGRRYVDAARTLMGRDVDVPEILDGYADRGTRAVDARLAALSGGAVFPSHVRDRLVDMMRGHDVIPSDRLDISDVRASADGITFTWKDETGQTGTGSALQVDGAWVVSDRVVSKAAVEAAKEAMLAHWDAEIADMLIHDWGLDPADVEDMREGVVPRYVWSNNAEYSDPYDLVSTYPVVVSFSNPTDSDEGYFAGFDPATGASDAYTFN